jgi:hypothetical protein
MEQKKKHVCLAVLGMFAFVFALSVHTSFAEELPSSDALLLASPFDDAASYPPDHPRWTIYPRPGTIFGTEDRVIYYYDFLIPLYFTEDSLLFFYPRYAFDDRGGYEWNLGLGYRYLIRNDSLLLGGNIFYDVRKSYTGKTYDQISVGAELFGEWFEGRVNVYFPLSDPKKIPEWRKSSFTSTGLDYYQGWEVPLSGVDYEVGFKLPCIEEKLETWVYVGGYHFDGKCIDPVHGMSARIEVYPSDFLRLNYEVRYDNRHHDEHYGEILLELPFSIENLVQGKNPFEDLGDVLPGSRTKEVRLYERIRKKRGVGLEKCCEKGSPEDIVELILRPCLDCQPSEVNISTTGIIYVNNANTSTNPSPDGSLENPYPTIGEAVTAANNSSRKIIFVFSGSGPYNEIVHLGSGIILWGQGYDPVGVGFPLDFPSVVGSSGPSIDVNHDWHIFDQRFGTINLAGSNIVMGFEVSTTSNWRGIFGEDVSNISIMHNLMHDINVGIYIQDRYGIYGESPCLVNHICIYDNYIDTSNDCTGNSNFRRNAYPIYLTGYVSDVLIRNNELISHLDLSRYGNSVATDTTGIVFHHYLNLFAGTPGDPPDCRPSYVDGLLITGNTINTSNYYGRLSGGISFNAGSLGGSKYINPSWWEYNESRVENFTITDNTIVAGVGEYSRGIRFGASRNGIISNNDITLTGNNTYSSGIRNDGYNEYGYGCLGSVEDITITENTITLSNTGSVAIGFDLRAHDADMDITNNTVVISSSLSNTISYPPTTHNYVPSYAHLPATPYAIGAALWGVGNTYYTTNYTFSGNTFSRVDGASSTDYGVCVTEWDDTTGISGHTTMGIAFDNNTIEGFETGVLLRPSLSTATGYLIDFGTGGLGSTGYNSITGFSGFAVDDNSGVGPGVTAQYNWWGGYPVIPGWFDGSVDYSNPLTTAP